MATIKVKEIEYTVKQSFRALMLLEELFNKTVEEIGIERVKEDGTKEYTPTTDLIELYYCMMKGANKTFDYSFDDFVELIDNEDFDFKLFQSLISSPDDKEAKKK